VAAARGSAPVPDVLLRLGRGNVLPGGVAYDAASGRVLVGDRHGRSVITISERLKTSMDLVRSSSAGFHEVMAIAIDARRGDLWVASASGGRPEDASDVKAGAALHKLQLVSGRPLARIEIDTEGSPARFTGLAVSREGVVFVLDANEGRLWTLRAGDETLTLATRIDVQRPSALAIHDRRQRVYVAHQDGLARVDPAGGTVATVAVPDSTSVSGIESLSWFKGSLVGLQHTGPRSRRLVRWHLNAAGTAVVSAEDVDASVPTCEGGSAASVSGDDVYYLAAESETESEGACRLVVRRVRLP
jgi:DNA-binding beta-propeller fold protein YncE